MKKGCAKLLVSLLAASVVLINVVYAVSERRDIDVEFVIEPSLTLTLSSDDVSIDNLIPGTADISNEITVSVSTNSESGYVMNATAGDITNNTTALLLREEETITDTFQSIAPGTPVQSITENRTWGYSINHGSTFSGMPLFTDTEHVEQISTSETPAIDEIPFLISARADLFQLPGEYRNIVTFTATANPVPDTIETVRYMQDFNDDIYASMEMEKQYQLIDKRDNKKYWIAKLADGNVWMTQNLAYNVSAPSVTLYPETSNVELTTVVPISGQVRFNESSYVDPVKTNGMPLSFVDIDKYIPGGDFVNDDGTYISEAALASTELLPSDDENWHYQVGVRYPSGSANIFCPKGWGLPIENPQDDVESQYDVSILKNNYSDLSAAPVYLTGHIGESANGYWSNTSGIVYGYVLNTRNGYSWVGNNDANYDGSMSYFSPARCVALRSTEYPFRYFANDGTDRIVYSYTPASWGGADASIKAIEPTITVVDTKFPLELVNHDFVGWASDPDATEAEYQPGDTVVTSMGSTNDLYAIWAPTAKTTIDEAFAAAGKTKVDGEHYAMQDMTVGICIDAELNTAADLIDTRDGSIYKVMKLPRSREGSDGICWMVDNLRLGDTDTDYLLTPSDSDVAADFTLPASITTTQSNSTPQIYVDDTVDDLGKYFGNRYNRYAVSGGTNQLDGNSSICPKGWTLPDSYGSSSYKRYDAVLNYYRPYIYYDSYEHSSSLSYGDTTNEQLKMLQDPLTFSYTGTYDGNNFEDRSVGYYWTKRGTNYYNYSLYKIYPTKRPGTIQDGLYDSDVETAFGALRCIIKTTQ